jgi:hypothetical protein
MVSVDGAAGSFILLLVGRERPGWTSLEDGALYTGLSYFRVILTFTCICVPYKNRIDHRLAKFMAGKA